MHIDLSPDIPLLHDRMLIVLSSVISFNGANRKEASEEFI